MREYRVLIIGFGNVGQAFFELLNLKKHLLGINFIVTGIIDRSRGLISNPSPGVISEAHTGKLLGKKVVLDQIPGFIEESNADIVCEFTDLNIKDKGEPAFTYLSTALRSGKHVITTNKGPVAFHYDELMELSRKYNRLIRFKGTVMAGTPSFNILDLLPGTRVEYFMGILNGTTNYILTRMYEGLTFDEALREAQELGYAEADPSLDIDGVDPALKAVILSRVIGWRHRFEDVEVQGIRDVDVKRHGDRVIKLIAHANADRVYVKPIPLERGNILANVSRNLNALTLKLDTLGEITVVGPGAGRMETAQAALTDLMYIVNHVNYLGR
ncbi:homoserine dehydrogenase [Vulcanisaeta souniana]|uniref:Homoserine dehydrogenase n=1 Tax=Vulcanisaeta souniana JCM 11219 TaxID=1293586 RepID=A0A830EDL6_9CREN|nr:homoserine dehydrogenase [Vulcanisaeta souniana]BDR92350.1 homoserine dehydrogenase [Vulcanisaeta souniana JCM 11219]GGI74898.1 homoserine dehydrogenase [Vulcanisaeta souniana JCM 11219]